MSWPVEIPPSTPPGVVAEKSGRRHFVAMLGAALLARPSKPAPSSTPFTALMLINARAMSASSLSNTGSPKSDRHAAGNDGHARADRVAILAQPVDEVGDLRNDRCVRAEEWVAIDFVPVDLLRPNGADLREVAAHAMHRTVRAGISSQSRPPPRALPFRAPTIVRRRDSRECRISSDTCSRRAPDGTRPGSCCSRGCADRCCR